MKILITMSRKKVVNYFTDLAIFGLFVLMSINGLMLQVVYHMKRNGPDYVYMNFDKSEWLLMHKASSVALTIGIAIHIALHSGWLKNAFKGLAFLKSGYKTKSLFYLFVAYFVSAATGFVSWIFTGFLSIGGPEARHAIMEFHDKISLILIILFGIHLVKKAKWLFDATRDLLSGGNGNGPDRPDCN